MWFLDPHVYCQHIWQPQYHKLKAKGHLIKSVWWRWISDHSITPNAFTKDKFKVKLWNKVLAKTQNKTKKIITRDFRWKGSQENSIVEQLLTQLKQLVTFLMTCEEVAQSTDSVYTLQNNLDHYLTTQISI